MAETTIEQREPSVGVRRPPALAHQVYLEIVKLVRIPMFSIPTF